jgi:transmembrane sensor
VDVLCVVVVKARSFMPTMDYNILIHKYLTGEITALEKEQLDDWLKEDSRNQQEFNEIKQIWESPDEEEEITDEHFQEELAKLESAVIESRKKDDLIKRYQIRSRIRNVVLLACIVLSGLAIAWPLLKSTQTTTISVSNNQNREIFLSDSSRVLLNSKSSIAFTETSRTRDVSLSGEALFEVTKDDRPFIISVNNALIKVLGTSFTVKAYPEEPLEVVVISGSVEVNYNDKTITLSKGEKSIASHSDPFAKSVNEDPNFNSWYTRKFEFKNTALEKILRLLEQQYAVSFKVSEHKLLNCRFTGKFDNAKLEDVLQTLSFSLDIKFSPQPGNHYNVSGQGCVP